MEAPDGLQDELPGGNPKICGVFGGIWGDFWGFWGPSGVGLEEGKWKVPEPERFRGAQDVRKVGWDPQIAGESQGGVPKISSG